MVKKDQLSTVFYWQFHRYGVPLQYMEFKMSSAEYSKNSVKSCLLECVVAWPLKFLSSRIERSLVLVSPTINTLPREANFWNSLEK